VETSFIQTIILGIVIFVSFKFVPRLMAGVPFVDPAKVHEDMQNDSDVILMDVRTKDEFKLDHATNSINVQPQTFGEDLDSKRPYMGQKIYVICLTSQRAGMAARKLKGFGFKNIAVVKGGMVRWKKLNLPIT